MRIGIFTDTYLPDVNGVVTVVRLMERELRRRGHEVYVFAPAYPSATAAASEADSEPDSDPGRDGQGPARVLRFPSVRFPYYEGMRVAIPYSREALRLIPTLEVIHSHDPFSLGLLALWASRRYEIPHVHTYHTFYAEYRRYLPRPIRPSRRAVERLSRAFCDRCDAIIAPSLQMKRELERYGITRPIWPLPFGLDEGEFSRPIRWDARRALGFPPRERLLLYVGRLGWEKRVDFLLRAFRLILRQRGDVRLVIAGEGPYRAALERYADELGLRGKAVFTGYLPRERLIDLYKQADLFVFASTTETQGLVLQEAMLAGTPPVAVGALGVLDVVRSGETGLLVGEDEGEGGFARACLRLLEDERERERLSAAARRWARSQTAQASVERLLGIYSEVRRTLGSRGANSGEIG